MRGFVRGSLLLVLSACSSAPGAPLTDASGDLAISVAKTSYAWSEVVPGGGAGVQGTITNTSDHSYYARLGDGFAGDEQTLLYVATSSDGALERNDGVTWVPIAGAQLIEGVREVVLLSHRTYAFVAQATGSHAAGTYRIAISFRDAPGAPDATSRHARSATFEIR